MQDCCRAALLALADDFLGGSLVWVDSGIADVIAWGAGIDYLAGLGAVSVCDLSTASPREAAAAAALAGGRLSRAVMLTSRLLHRAEGSLAAACAAAAPYTSAITVACSASEAAHHDELPSLYGPAAYADLSSRLRQRLRALDPSLTPPTVAVKFCPLGVLPISGSFFVLPAAAAAVAGARVGGRALGFGTPAHAADSDSDDGDAAAAEGAAQTAAPPGVKQGRTQGVNLLAHALAQAAAAMGYRAEAFGLGPASQAVGRALSFVPPVAAPGGGPPPTETAAFVLVDRAADLVTPALHADLLVARMFDAVHDRRPDCAAAEAAGGGGGFEAAQVLVPMPLAEEAGAAAAAASDEVAASGVAEGREGKQVLDFLPGALSHPQDAAAASNLGFLLMRRGRDAALFVRKWLREAARKEGVQAAGRFKPGTVSPQELRALAVALAGDPAAALRHSPLLQLAAAAAAALEGGAAGHWEAAARQERALLVACSEGSDAAAEQLTDLLDAAGRAAGVPGGAALPLPDVVALLLVAYCVLPEHQPWYVANDDSRCTAFAAEQEERLRDALVGAVVACSACWAGGGAAAEGQASWLPAELPAQLVAAAGSSDGAAGRRSVQLEVRLAAEGLLQRMRELSLFRKRTAGALGRRKDNEGADAAPESLLLRLASAILERRPVEELVQAGTSLAGLLKNGLGRMGLQRRPQPGDYPAVVLFVVGGVSWEEAHEVLAGVERRLAAASAAAAEAGGGSGTAAGKGGGITKMPRVIVGGTALLRPAEVGQHAL